MIGLYIYTNSFGYGKINACLTLGNAAGCESIACKEIVITIGIEPTNGELPFTLKFNVI